MLLFDVITLKRSVFTIRSVILVRFGWVLRNLPAHLDIALFRLENDDFFAFFERFDVCFSISAVYRDPLYFFPVYINVVMLLLFTKSFIEILQHSIIELFSWKGSFEHIFTSNLCWISFRTVRCKCLYLYVCLYLYKRFIVDFL